LVVIVAAATMVAAFPAVGYEYADDWRLSLKRRTPEERDITVPPDA
jgi:hypothetical protein